MNLASLGAYRSHSSSEHLLGSVHDWDDWAARLDISPRREPIVSKNSENQCPIVFTPVCFSSLAVHAMQGGRVRDLRPLLIKQQKPPTTKSAWACRGPKAFQRESYTHSERTGLVGAWKG